MSTKPLSGSVFSTSTGILPTAVTPTPNKVARHSLISTSNEEVYPVCDEFSDEPRLTRTNLVRFAKELLTHAHTMTRPRETQQSVWKLTPRYQRQDLCNIYYSVGKHFSPLKRNELGEAERAIFDRTKRIFFRAFELQSEENEEDLAQAIQETNTFEDLSYVFYSTLFPSFCGDEWREEWPRHFVLERPMQFHRKRDKESRNPHLFQLERAQTELRAFATASLEFLHEERENTVVTLLLDYLPQELIHLINEYMKDFLFLNGVLIKVENNTVKRSRGKL